MDKKIHSFQQHETFQGMGEEEIEEFLTDLAVRGKVAASTQNQAFDALLFLYRQVLKMDFFGEINALRAKTPEGLPTVLTVDETFALIDAMPGTYQLMAKILYGSGLRGIEGTSKVCQEVT